MTDGTSSALLSALHAVHLSFTTFPKHWKLKMNLAIVADIIQSHLEVHKKEV